MNTSALDAVRRESLQNPDRFWLEAARDIDWHTPPSRALDAERARYARWFPGAELNTCHNALDRHVAAGLGERTAVVYDSPVTGTLERISYADALDRVARLAGALRARGVQRGDRVIIFMPMVPEAVWAMLACARLGAIHSVVFGGFASTELAKRIDDARPKAILSASCGIEVQRRIAYKPLLDAALALSEHRPELVAVLQRPQEPAELVGDEIDWATLIRGASPVDPVPVEATDPLYILYTSGTTGRPKGVVRDNGGHAVALRWSMENVFASRPGDVFWAASDIGWAVGHSYTVYGPLLTGATTILYEGKPVGTPDAGAFWRVAAEHRVRSLFTAPTAIRAIRREDPEGTLLAPHDLSQLDALFLAGERLDPETYRWATKRLGIPVIDHWWQTETGWPVAASCRGIEEAPLKSGSVSRLVPGWDAQVLDDDGVPVPPGEEGAIALRLPLPPGALTTIWGDEERFVSSYLAARPGYYVTGDGGHLDDDGYLFVMGRLDDVINVAGHRLSTGAMEEVIASHPGVVECAVVGVDDQLKGQVPLAFVVRPASPGEASDDELERELIALVRKQIGAIATLRGVTVVPRLPKTRSGKVLRATMRKIASGRPYEPPATIEDVDALDDVARAIARS